MALSLLLLMGDQKCFEQVRWMRWPEGVFCLAFGSHREVKRGFEGKRGCWGDPCPD